MPASDSYTLSRSDVVKLRRIIELVERDPSMTRSLSRDEEQEWSPETYLVKAPAGGVPAGSTATCEIYRSPTDPTGHSVDVATRPGESVSADALFTASRDNYGTWWAMPSSSGTITVEGYGGAPTYSGVSKLTIFTVEGLRLINPEEPGQAILGAVAADPTQQGMMAVGGQAFQGPKTFQDPVYITGGTFSSEPLLELMQPTGGTTLRMQLVIKDIGGGSYQPTLQASPIATLTLAAQDIFLRPSSYLSMSGPNGVEIFTQDSQLANIGLYSGSLFVRKYSNVIGTPIAEGYGYTGYGYINGILCGAPTGIPPTGPAGGSLTGTYPDPSIAVGAVGTLELADGAVLPAKSGTAFTVDLN